MLKVALVALNPCQFALALDDWPSKETTPDKGLIKFLEKHLTKHDKDINLELIAILYTNIDKWIANEKIGNELSNKLWTNKNITNSPKNAF